MLTAQSRQRYFMEQALREAEAAYAQGEIPVGAVVVCGGRIVGRGHNLTQRLGDPTAHAEMLALTAAAEHLGAKYLRGCELYVTLEPCPMCAGAIFWAQPDHLHYAATDVKRGFSRHSPTLLHPRTHLTTGLLADAAQELLQRFFRHRRNPLPPGA